MKCRPIKVLSPPKFSIYRPLSPSSKVLTQHSDYPALARSRDAHDLISSSRSPLLVDSLSVHAAPGTLGLRSLSTFLLGLFAQLPYHESKARIPCRVAFLGFGRLTLRQRFSLS